MKKVYTVYKTTNKVNGKYYIGVHKTSDLYDDYLGSGKYLKRAIEKYGIENFEKEIIDIFDSPEEAYTLEKILVTFELIETGQIYNLTEGGRGKGFEYANKEGMNYGGEEKRKLGSINGKKKFLDLYYNNINFRTKHKQHLKQIGVKGNINVNIKYPNGTFKDKLHTETTKRKIGMSNSIHQQGKGNSQYGTCWIYNESTKENKKIKKEDLDFWIESLWIKGRKIK